MNRLFFMFNVVLLAVTITNENQLPQNTHNNRLQAASTNKEVQINRLPHPFNVNGSLPFQVWIDGQRLPMNSKAAKAIVDGLDLQFEQPTNTAAIHSGAGWLRPLNINNER